MKECLRVVGNFIVYNEQFCAKVIHEMQLLDVLRHIISVGTMENKKDVLWTLSNIAANGENEAVAIVKSSLLTNIIYCAKDTCLAIRKQAVWALSNIIINIHDSAILQDLIYVSIVNLIYDILVTDFEQGRMILLVLSAMNHLFEKLDNAKNIFVGLGGIEVLERLQLSQYYEVSFP